MWSKRATVYEGAVRRGYSSASLVTDEHRVTFRVEGNDQRCTVRATNYEVWHNNVKLDEINADWAKAHVFDPMLDAINEQLDRGAN